MWGDGVLALGAVTVLCLVWGMGRAYREARALAQVVEVRCQTTRR